jgi:DNA-binding MarR family transcriptional regulator
VEVLRLLAVHRCATRSWLAELLGVRPQALHRVLRALAERAWVSSRPSTEDRRARLWLPTEEGLRVLREALELMEAAEEEWLRGLSQGERDALEALIRAEAEARWYGATGGQLKKEAELSSSSA